MTLYYYYFQVTIPRIPSRNVHSDQFLQYLPRSRNEQMDGLESNIKYFLVVDNQGRLIESLHSTDGAYINIIIHMVNS